MPRVSGFAIDGTIPRDGFLGAAIHGYVHPLQADYMCTTWQSLDGSTHCVVPAAVDLRLTLPPIPREAEHALLQALHVCQSHGVFSCSMLFHVVHVVPRVHPEILQLHGVLVGGGYSSTPGGSPLSFFRFPSPEFLVEVEEHGTLVADDGVDG